MLFKRWGRQYLEEDDVYTVHQPMPEPDYNMRKKIDRVFTSEDIAKDPNYLFDRTEEETLDLTAQKDIMRNMDDKQLALAVLVAIERNPQMVYTIMCQAHLDTIEDLREILKHAKDISRDSEQA